MSTAALCVLVCVCEPAVAAVDTVGSLCSCEWKFAFEATIRNNTAVF